MSISKIIRNPITDTIEATNAWLIRTREEGSTLTDQEKSGINFSVILNSACFFEGSIEWLLHQLLDAHSIVFHSIDKPDFDIRRSMNRFFNRLQDDLRDRVCRATGPENYGEMFEVLVGRRLSECVGDANTWEGLRVLFYLRNVIAHGRMASAEHTLVDSTSGSEQWEEKFKGGYAKTLEYLRKRGIESGKFGEHDVETLLFKAAVADHFWQLTQDAVKAIRAAVGAELARADTIRASRKPEPATPPTAT